MSISYVSARLARSLRWRNFDRRLGFKTWVVAGLAIAAGWPMAVAARPILSVQMRLGQSISPNYQYAIALSDESRSPEANLVDPNISAGIDDVTFLENWDYL
ncbi:MAG: hypothetical protein AAFX40_02635, partial [Cyanobacteria bacterium J06639_1]